jgi:ribonucleotide reductase alpha subunit
MSENPSSASSSTRSPSTDSNPESPPPSAGDGAPGTGTAGNGAPGTEAPSNPVSGTARRSHQYTLEESDVVENGRSNAEIFETSISQEVYEQNYQYGTDGEVPDTWYRNARAMATVEDDVEGWTRKFYQLLSGKGLGLGPFPFTPGGRIFANAGTTLGKATLINCFVSGFQGYDQDSMDAIQDELSRQAKILASEGGYGFCCHTMRPRGSRIGGVGSMTPGAVQMLDIWNSQAATIVAGSGMESDRDDVKDKIRKGAQMVTMGIWHPDVLEFIEAKQEPGRLHKFNMSVLVSDAFMEAVRNDDEWALRFPDFEGEPEFYRKHWTGDLQAYQEKGGTVKVWRNPETGEKAVYRAREIWDKIMESTYNRNEPGVIFVDTINRENNLAYTEHINATNPCVTGDTWVMTSNGPRQVQQLLDEPFEAVVDGNAYPATNFFKTGTKDVFRLQTKEGYELRLTADHEVRVATDVRRYSIEKEWREAQDLEPGDKVILHNHRDTTSWNGDGNAHEGYLAGLFVGDGSVGSHGPVLSVWEDGHAASIQNKVMDCVAPMDKRSDFSGWHSIKERNEHRLRLTAIDQTLERFDLTDKTIGREIEEASSGFYCGFLQGFFDADGSVQGTQTKGVSVRLAQSDLDRLKAVQRMLQRLGIVSTIYQNRREAGERELPNGKGGTDLYHTQAQHELVISNDNLQRFADLIGFTHDGKQDRLQHALGSYNRAMNRERFVATVESVEPDGTEPVYDATVEEVHSFDANGLYVHNCGEQVLPVGGVCLLGNFNLTQFVDMDAGQIDYDTLDELIPRAVRFLDNVNDLSYVPLEEQQWNLQNKRRIGLGHFGDGSALMMMKKRYGSDEAVQTMREFQQHLANKAYQASAQLAKEKEPFPLFDRDYYLNEAPFIQRLSEETREMIAEYGLRNSHLLSIQPTGNTSTLANAPSSGIEPVFMHSYIRTSEQPSIPKELGQPEMSPRAYSAGQEIDADGTSWIAEKQGDEIVLRCQEDGYEKWQIHPTRGPCKDEKVEDYAVRHMKERGEWDAGADWAVTTQDLTVDDHLSQMEALAPFVDSSMSKTVNVPADYPFEEFKDLYRKAHATGIIKGVTTYRAGTMSAVLSGDDEDDDKGAKVPRTDAPDRPETLPCAIHRVRYRGDHWTVLVGFLDDDPYEVFAFTSEGDAPLFEEEAKWPSEGKIKKVKSQHYALLTNDDDTLIDDITSQAPSDEVRVETRLVSTALRHGSSIDFLVKQLEKAEGSIASFGRAMAKALSAHASSHEVTCDKCGSSNVRHVEGCMTCADCGHSRCS